MHRLPGWAATQQEPAVRRELLWAYGLLRELHLGVQQLMERQKQHSPSLLLRSRGSQVFGGRQRADTEQNEAQTETLEMEIIRYGGEQ
jgi:hypothetical protein